MRLSLKDEVIFARNAGYFQNMQLHVFERRNLRCRRLQRWAVQQSVYRLICLNNHTELYHFVIRFKREQELAREGGEDRAGRRQESGVTPDDYYRARRSRCSLKSTIRLRFSHKLYYSKLRVRAWNKTKGETRKQGYSQPAIRCQLYILIPPINQRIAAAFGKGYKAFTTIVDIGLYIGKAAFSNHTAFWVWHREGCLAIRRFQYTLTIRCPWYRTKQPCL